MTLLSRHQDVHAAFFGAVPSQDGVRFRIWAPGVELMQVRLHTGRAAGVHPLARDEHGVFETWIRAAAAGDRYTYVLDAKESLPDPASRYQPDGVHGQSEIVDASAFQWHDDGWKTRAVRDHIVYELHVGTFSPEGTFEGVRKRLPYLRDLGITAIELMPVADFPGARNWGYDGVALFAPSRAYGRPDDLRRLVDAAHGEGLAVFLDVVYNHLGPEGAYLPRFAPAYITDRHHTPWGGAVNLDAAGSESVRRFILDNAVHWVLEYHVDGLRLDATHALIDQSARHIVVDIAETVRRSADRHIVVHAEDHRNNAAMVADPGQRGWGLDGVWADDFHHVIRRMTAGDSHSYYADFKGTAGELAHTITQGWLYTGQPSAHMKRPRGTDPAHVPMYRFVVCTQNHDQVGNRAQGERLHHTIAPEEWRAASVVLLTVPMLPLLFMGQEWAASSPFQYFTDLEPGLGRLVTDGRRREFAGFPEFSDPARRQQIPDPQATSTFDNSHLRWEEHASDVHARTLSLYRALIALRRDHPALSGSDELRGEAVATSDSTIVVRRTDRRETFWVIAHFGVDEADVDLVAAAARLGVDVRNTTFEIVLDTEHGEFTAEPLPVDVQAAGADARVRFSRAGAVILRQT